MYRVIISQTTTTAGRACAGGRASAAGDGKLLLGDGGRVRFVGYGFAVGWIESIDLWINRYNEMLLGGNGADWFIPFLSFFIHV